MEFEIDQENNLISIPYFGVTRKVIAGCGEFYITILLDSSRQRPIYLIPRTGKGGGCAVETDSNWFFALRSTHLSSYAKRINKVFATDDIGQRLYKYTKLAKSTCEYGDMCCLHQITRMLFQFDLDLDMSLMNEEEDNDE